MSTSSKELLQRAVAIMGTQKALAKYLGRSPERVSRVVGGGRPDILGCLRLAELLNERPTTILQTFDYAAEADALQRLYEAGGHLRKDERAVIDALAAMPREHRDRFSALILAYAPAGSAPTSASAASSPGTAPSAAASPSETRHERHAPPSAGTARRRSRARKTRG